MYNSNQNNNQQKIILVPHQMDNYINHIDTNYNSINSTNYYEGDMDVDIQTMDDPNKSYETLLNIGTDEDYDEDNNKNKIHKSTNLDKIKFIFKTLFYPNANVDVI